MATEITGTGKSIFSNKILVFLSSLHKVLPVEVFFNPISFHSIGIPSEWALCPIKIHTGRAFQAPFARDSYFPPI
jgi:hypothetical protein